MDFARLAKACGRISPRNAGISAENCGAEPDLGFLPAGSGGLATVGLSLRRVKG
jgi:hypothetical protein